MFETIYRLLNGNDFTVMESFELPGTLARYSEIPKFLHESALGAYLGRQYSGSLWSHQAQALEMLGQGDNAVISTGTASGKSLVFRAIAFHKALQEPSSRIVVFYPLLALAADQLRGWQEMARDLDLPTGTVGRIDGTVNFNEREKVLKTARIVVMTPDVCHAWLMSRLAMPFVKEFVGQLSTVIMDEAHTLEGVFGSNYAFFIRRLVAARNHLLGNESRFRPLQMVAATATISNPGEHMQQLTGAKFSVVDHETDGAPRHERVVAHVASPEGGELQLAIDLQRRALYHGKEGGFITFVDSRKGVETLAIATQQETAVEELAGNSDEVVPYRAGYTPEERQRIEKRLQDGILRGVVSTSALELGIDLPHLRVGFNIGVPATRKAYRQRLGRVGRNGPGAFVVIAPPNAFRRYGTSFREYHDMSVEPSYLYLDNRFMQFAHGRCLAEELDAVRAPSNLPARVLWPNNFGNIYIQSRPGGNRDIEFDRIAELGGDTPHRNYPLRNVGEKNFQIKRHQDADPMGNANESQALRECYPGATYLHGAHAYEVRSWNTNVAVPFVRVRSTSPQRRTRPYITTYVNARITATEVIDGHLLRSDSGFLAECQMLLTERVDGYTDERTGQFHSYQDLQQQDSNMKSRSRHFRTSGVILCIDQDWFKKWDVKSLVSDRLHEMFAHEYSMLMHDIGSSATNVYVRDAEGKTWRSGCIAVFDNTYGSLRFTERLYIEFKHILNRLSVAADSEPEVSELRSIINKLSEEFDGFSPGTAWEEDQSNAPEGYERVFATGSRVIYQEQGTIPSDVEIVQAAILPPNNLLYYQVQLPTRPGQASSRRYIPADRVEPSADADAWKYAWWNRATQAYENPPDGDE